MRVAIVGAGAMGGLFAYLLSRAEETETWLLDIRPERVQKIRADGLFVEGISGDHHLHPSITLEADRIGRADLVLVCVKSPNTHDAVLRAKPLVGPETTVLTLQNGLGNLEAIERALGPGRALGGTTAMGATVLAPNRIRHAGWGETVIGEPQGARTPRAEAILELFRRCELEVSFTEDLPGLLWSKLLINVGINALTALCRLHNGKLLDHEGTRAVQRAAVEEAARVVQALGIRLLYDDPVEKVAGVCRATAGNISSMLQDVLKAKQTEIEQINGAVIREARRRQIPAPANELLVELVRTLQESYAERIETWAPAG